MNPWRQYICEQAAAYRVEHDMAADISEVFTIPIVAIVRPAPENSSIAPTGSTPGLLATTKSLGTESSPMSPVSKRIGADSPSSVTQQCPLTMAKNLIFSRAGKRMAQGPPAVKPPVTTASAFVSVSTSENGSTCIFVLSRQELALSSIQSANCDAYLEAIAAAKRCGLNQHL